MHTGDLSAGREDVEVGRREIVGDTEGFEVGK